MSESAKVNQESSTFEKIEKKGNTVNKFQIYETDFKVKENQEQLDSQFNEINESQQLEKNVSVFNKNQTKILQKWFLEHIDHPYVNKQEKIQLCEQTGLSRKQITGWFTNNRKRKFQKVYEIAKRKKKDQGKQLKKNKQGDIDFEYIKEVLRIMFNKDLDEYIEENENSKKQGSQNSINRSNSRQNNFKMYMNGKRKQSEANVENSYCSKDRHKIIKIEKQNMENNFTNKLFEYQSNDHLQQNSSQQIFAEQKNLFEQIQTWWQQSQDVKQNEQKIQFPDDQVDAPTIKSFDKNIIEQLLLKIVQQQNFTNDAILENNLQKQFENQCQEHPKQLNQVIINQKSTTNQYIFQFEGQNSGNNNQKQEMSISQQKNNIQISQNKDNEQSEASIQNNDDGLLDQDQALNLKFIQSVVKLLDQKIEQKEIDQKHLENNEEKNCQKVINKEIKQFKFIPIIFMMNVHNQNQSNNKSSISTAIDPSYERAKEDLKLSLFNNKQTNQESSDQNQLVPIFSIQQQIQTALDYYVNKHQKQNKHLLQQTDPQKKKEHESNEVNVQKEIEVDEYDKQKLISQDEANENEKLKEKDLDQLVNSVHDIVETQLSSIFNNTKKINLEKTPTRAAQISNNTPKQYFTQPPKLQQVQQQYFNTANSKFMQESNYAPNFSNQEQKEIDKKLGNIAQTLNLTDPTFNEKKKKQNFKSIKNIMEMNDKTPERITIRQNNQFQETIEELEEKMSKKKNKKQESSKMNNDKQNFNINLSLLDPSKVPSPTFNLQQFASNINLDYDPYTKNLEQNQTYQQTQELHQILFNNIKNEQNKQVVDDNKQSQNDIIEQNNQSTIEKININLFQNNCAVQESEKDLPQELLQISQPVQNDQLTSFFQDMIQKAVEMYSQQKAELLQNQIDNLDKNYQQIQQNEQSYTVQPIYKQDDKILKMHKSILKIIELETEQEKILQKIKFLYKNDRSSMHKSNPSSLISFEEKNQNNFQESNQSNDKIQQQYLETSKELNHQIISLQNMIGSEQDKNLENGSGDKDFASSQNFKNQKSSIKSQPLEKHKLDELMHIVISSYERNKNHQNLLMQNLSQKYTSQSKNNICGFQGFENIQQFNSSLANILKITFLGSVNVDYPSSNSHILYNSRDSNGSNGSGLNNFNNSQKQNHQQTTERYREGRSSQDKRKNLNFNSSGSNNSGGSAHSQFINSQNQHNQKESKPEFLKYQKQRDQNYFLQHQINSLNVMPNDNLQVNLNEKQNLTTLKQMIMQQQAQSQLNNELSFANDFFQISSYNQDVIKSIFNQFQEPDQIKPQSQQQMAQIQNIKSNKLQELTNNMNEQKLQYFSIKSNKKIEFTKQDENQSEFDAQSKLIQSLIQLKMEENPKYDFMILIQNILQELNSQNNQHAFTTQSQEMPNKNQFLNSTQLSQSLQQNNGFQTFQQVQNIQMLKSESENNNLRQEPMLISSSFKTSQQHLLFDNQKNNAGKNLTNSNQQNNNN